MFLTGARRVRGLVVLGILGVLFLILAGRALANGYVTADYSGTWDEAFVRDLSNPAADTESMHFVWDERETAHVFGGTPSAFATVKVLSRTLTITGTMTKSYAPPNAALSCTGVFSIRPGGKFPLFVSAGTSSNPLLSNGAIVPLGGDYSQANGPPNCSYAVNGNAGISSGPLRTTNYTVPLTPLFEFKLGRRRYTKTIRTLDLSTDGTYQVAVNATFRAATSATKPPTLPPAPPLATPVRDQVKRNALAALRAAVTQALYPCGVGVGVGATILGAGPVGLAAGAALLTTGGPLCSALLKQIVAEEKTYKDPPRADYLVVAHVVAANQLASRAAGCATFTGSVKTFCARVAAAAATLLGAVTKAENLALAIEKTVARDTAAAAAHNQTAVNLQEQALKSLSPRFTAGLGAQTRAAAGLQAALRSRGVSLRTTVIEFKLEAKHLLLAVARRGVRASTLRKVAPGALRPRRLDPIAAF